MSTIRLEGSVLTDDDAITGEEMAIEYLLDVCDPQPVAWRAPRSCFVFEILLEAASDVGRFRIGVYRRVQAGALLLADLRGREVRREPKAAT
jgi:hypothetical protein